MVATLTKYHTEQINNFDNSQQDLTTVDNVVVNVSYKNDIKPDVLVTKEEIRNYIKRGNLQKPDSTVERLDLLIDGDDVEISYEYSPVNFDRIRRITGYLVGTMDRWNDAKLCEESDRVKHSVIK